MERPKKKPRYGEAHEGTSLNIENEAWFDLSQPPDEEMVVFDATQFSKPKKKDKRPSSLQIYPDTSLTVPEGEEPRAPLAPVESNTPKSSPINTATRADTPIPRAYSGFKRRYPTSTFSIPPRAVCRKGRTTLTHNQVLCLLLSLAGLALGVMILAVITMGPLVEKDRQHALLQLSHNDTWSEELTPPQRTITHRPVICRTFPDHPQCKTIAKPEIAGLRDQIIP